MNTSRESAPGTSTEQGSPSKFQLLLKRRWALVPIGLLFSLVGIQLVMLTISINDPGFAVETDYYEKATQWDEHMAQQRVNQRLGYVIQAKVKPSEVDGDQDIELSIVDGDAGALAGASVSAIAFHHARSAARSELKFEEQETGYRTTLERPRSGLWEVRVSVRKDGELFTQTLSLDVRAYQRAAG